MQTEEPCQDGMDEKRRRVQPQGAIEQDASDGGANAPEAHQGCADHQRQAHHEKEGDHQVGVAASGGNEGEDTYLPPEQAGQGIMRGEGGKETHSGYTASEEHSGASEKTVYQSVMEVTPQERTE